MYDPLWHVVLHQPEIPYNTGSVGRTCVAIGAKLWLVRPLGFRLDDYYLRPRGSITGNIWSGKWPHWPALVPLAAREPLVFHQTCHTHV